MYVLLHKCGFVQWHPGGDTLRKGHAGCYEGSNSSFCASIFGSAKCRGGFAQRCFEVSRPDSHRVQHKRLLGGTWGRLLRSLSFGVLSESQGRWHLPLKDGAHSKEIR